MCISRSHTEMSLPSSSVRAHLPGYPWRLAKMWGGGHTGLIILLKKGVYIKAPERVHHLCPWISRLKDRHIQSCWCQPFPLPTPSVASVPMPVAHSLTHSGVSIRVWCSPVWGGEGKIPSTNCSALGLWWPSAQSCCPSTGGKSCLSPLPHPRGSPILLRCTPH